VVIPGCISILCRFAQHERCIIQQRRGLDAATTHELVQREIPQAIRDLAGLDATGRK
jgi:hypothetical protein